MKLSASTVSELKDYFLSEQSRIVEVTRALVETESPSGDEAGSKAVVSLLANETSAIPGLEMELVASPNYGEHLRLSAFGDPSESNPIVILGHTDTVHPRGSLNQRSWRIEDDRAFGPGVFDMKGSCAVAIELFRLFQKTHLIPQRPLVVLLTCDEETGSPAGRALVEAEARNAHAVLVLEPPASGGRVKTGRKGTGIFRLEAHGCAAHAGLEPEKGASAVLELARQTERLHALNGTSGGINVNVGVFKGGTLPNVVPEDARVEVDVRFGTMEEAAYVENELRNLRPFDDRVTLTVTGGINRPPLVRNEKVLELYSQAEAVARLLGFVLGETQVGGASDGNFAAAAGAAVLDGLGIAGDGAHAAHEHIVLSDIPQRGALIAGLILSL
jgi:glutamate carboxypeptidase